MTNADKIRAMSDEEMAIEISWLVVCAVKQMFPIGWKASDEELIAGTADDLVDWLKEEVTE